MENVLNYFKSAGLDTSAYLTACCILLIGSFVLGLTGKILFGKKSILSVSVSSVFAILFIFWLTLLLSSKNPTLHALTSPLPFVTIHKESLLLINLFKLQYTALCSEILGMILLAFFVNLADRWLPKTKNIFSWIFFRLLTVIIGYSVYLLTIWLFSILFPQGIAIYAPVVLLTILLLMLVTGSLKFLIGAFLCTLDPVVGGLYTFFFSSLIGRQLTKAVLTTTVLVGLLIALRYAGIFSIAITNSALLAYLPALLLLAAIWYLFSIIL